VKVPFFDRTRADAPLEAELTAAFQRVLRSGRFILGAEVERFERAAAEMLGVRHAIGVSSGSDALLVALLALGVGPGDEVVCPAYTFFATAGAIARLGATPVLVDIEAPGFTLDPRALAAAITPRTRAIVPVHLFGRAADLDAIARAAGSIPIVEDAAQAFGATIGDRQAGSVGAMGCFSFFPTKNLGGFGDAGLVVTDDADLARRARMLRAHGSAEKHRHALVGGNFRLDALQAALLSVELPHVADRLAARRANAARYDALFSAAGLAAIDRPAIEPGATFNQYVIRAPGARDALRAFLAENGVDTEIYYPLPLHLQPCFAALGKPEGSLPEAERAARETLALPIFPGLQGDEIDYVVGWISAFFA
jgi:dTDP-4-amino-4,6-dideoxygalactose transaminase